MTALANTDITTTIIDRKWYGKQRQHLVKLVFGNSTLTYPSGGVAFPSAASLGLKSPLNFLQILDDVGTTGTEWKPDYANSKLRAYRSNHIPMIVVAETVTLTSNAGTLKYLPAYIFNAQSNTAVPLQLVPHSVTPATTQMSVNWTTGALATLSSDSYTSAVISYIPQQPTGAFAQSNMAINEVITQGTAGAVNTAARAMAVQYVYQTASTASRLKIAHVAGSNAVSLDITSSGNTAITSNNAANNGKAAVVTYLKYTGFGDNAASVFFDQASLTCSQTLEFGKTAGDYVGGFMIPNCGGNQIIDLKTATYVTAYLGETVTPAAGVASFNTLKQLITTAETVAADTMTDTGFMFVSPLLVPKTGLSELTVNDSPAATTLYAIAYA